MINHNSNRILPILLSSVLLFLRVGAGLLPRAQVITSELPAQPAGQSSSLKSEVIAPGIEHIQITRGYKSEKEATGPWFINMLRIHLTKAQLRMVHAMD